MVTQPLATGTAQQTRSIVVTFLGAVVRPMGNWMPIGGTVELLGQMGLDSPPVRTAVFRLKQKGWLLSEVRDGARGYALTPLAFKTLSAGDETIWHARQPATLGEGWCILNISIPEALRSKRDQLRAHLASLGFGNVGTAMWIAPARMQDAASAALAELGLEKYAAMFVGSYAGGQDLTAVLYQSWDLHEIDERYKHFIHSYQDLLSELPPRTQIDPREAFVSYLSVVNQWRKLPFLDPGLPPELLSSDWSAPAAILLFERLIASLQPAALAHAANHWPS